MKPDEYIKNLVKDVCQNNPGALTVITRLQWFNKWEKMLEYFKDTEIVGGALWAKYKDEFHEDIYAFGHAIEHEMFGYYKGENTSRFEATKIMHKFL